MANELEFYFKEREEEFVSLMLDIDIPVAETFHSWVKGEKSHKSGLPFGLMDELELSARTRAALMLGTMAAYHLRQAEKDGDIEVSIPKVVEKQKADKSFAITEVSRTSNLASDYAGRNIYAYKQWNATLDGRTRITHRAAHGQVVRTAQDFIVNGHTMQFPGDWHAPPEETANCRCVMNFYTEDDVITGWYPVPQRHF